MIASLVVIVTSSLDRTFSIMSHVATNVLNFKTCLAIAVILITFLLLTSTATNAFRQSTSFSGMTLMNLKVVMKKDDVVSTPVCPRRPILSKAKSESMQSIRKKFDDLALMFEERKGSVKKLLDEFSQPFMDTSFNINSSSTNLRFGDNENNQEEEEEHTVVIRNENAPEDGVTHFCFLVHGYNGRPADLLYLRTAMANLAEKELSSTNRQREGASESTENTSKMIVLHSCQSNWGRTSDGVEKGGVRILDEIRSVIRDHIRVDTDNDGDQRAEPMNITVSLVGNSLGGLYSRYAVAKLAEGSTSPEEEFLLLDGKIRAHFNVFCTTATPHLGISGHTYIPIPRSAEIGIGKIMGQTGRDIFRLSDLIKTMCTCPSYLQPLRSFRKRIAYANAYKTDFVVPTNTAAFLNADSTYPHHISDEDGNEFDGIENSSPKNGMVVATFHTPQRDPNLRRGTDFFEGLEEPESLSLRDGDKRTNELLNMSICMDELGWKKVIVDVREHMPVSIKIPKIVKKRSSGLQSSSSDMDSNNGEIDSSDRSTKLGIFESRDVANAFSSPSDVLAFPLGHNTLVAVEKHGLSKTVFQGGRPLMDELAKEIVEEILAWDP
mmetsp:Transcript_1412/g.2576  ORF Transcript_1412/g.2576 Transcript_1412/m.2576 type:complete len:607 (-) Transcript_1412:4794-6614(-)